MCSPRSLLKDSKIRVIREKRLVEFVFFKCKDCSLRQHE